MSFIEMLFYMADTLLPVIAVSTLFSLGWYIVRTMRETLKDVDAIETKLKRKRYFDEWDYPPDEDAYPDKPKRKDDFADQPDWEWLPDDDDEDLLLDAFRENWG